MLKKYKSLFCIFIFLFLISFSLISSLQDEAENRIDFAYAVNYAIVNVNYSNDSGLLDGLDSTAFWRVDGSSTATGNWDISSYEFSAGKITANDFFSAIFNPITDPLWDANYDIAKFENDDHGIIQILTPNNRDGGIAFADPESRSMGGYFYEHDQERASIRANESSVLFIEDDAIYPADNQTDLGTSGFSFDDLYITTAGQLFADGRSFLFSNIYNRSGDTMTGLPHLRWVGTQGSKTDYLSIENTLALEDNYETESSILWKHRTYDVVSPEEPNASRLSIGREENWTNTATTQDAYLSWYILRNGGEELWLHVTSDSKVKLYGDLNLSTGNYYGNGSQLTGVSDANWNANWTAYNSTWSEKSPTFDQDLNTTDSVTFNNVTTTDKFFNDITSAGSVDQYQADMSLDLSANDLAQTYRGFYSDWDYEGNSASGFFTPNLNWLELDLDLTDTASIVFTPVVKAINIDIDANNGFSLSNIFNFDVTASGSSGSSTGVFYVEIEDDSPTGNIVATRTASKITDTTNSLSAIGYQGFAQNSDTGQDGKAIALNPYIYDSSGTYANYWIQGLQAGSVNSKERSVFFHSNAVGHGLISEGGLAIMGIDSDNFVSHPADHVASWNTTIADGFLYVQNESEFDDVIHADGGINVSAQNITNVDYFCFATDCSTYLRHNGTCIVTSNDGEGSCI